jgi:hypothetical protein
MSATCTCTVEYANKAWAGPAPTSWSAANGNSSSLCLPSPSPLSRVSMVMDRNAGFGDHAYSDNKSTSRPSSLPSVRKLVVEELSTSTCSSSLQIMSMLITACDLLATVSQCDKCLQSFNDDLDRPPPPPSSSSSFSSSTKGLIRNHSFSGSSTMSGYSAPATSSASRSRDKASTTSGPKGLVPFLRFLQSHNACALCTVHIHSTAGISSTYNTAATSKEVTTSMSTTTTHIKPKRVSPLKVCHAILFPIGVNRAMLFIDSQTSSQQSLYKTIWQKFSVDFLLSQGQRAAVSLVNSRPPSRTGGLFGGDGALSDRDSSMLFPPAMLPGKMSRGLVALNQSMQQQQSETNSSNSNNNSSNFKQNSLLQRIHGLDDTRGRDSDRVRDREVSSETVEPSSAPGHPASFADILSKQYQTGCAEDKGGTGDRAKSDGDDSSRLFSLLDESQSTRMVGTLAAVDPTLEFFVSATGFADTSTGTFGDRKAEATVSHGDGINNGLFATVVGRSLSLFPALPPESTAMKSAVKVSAEDPVSGIDAEAVPTNLFQFLDDDDDQGNSNGNDNNVNDNTDNDNCNIENNLDNEVEKLENEKEKCDIDIDDEKDKDLHDKPQSAAGEAARIVAVDADEHTASTVETDWIDGALLELDEHNDNHMNPREPAGPEATTSYAADADDDAEELLAREKEKETEREALQRKSDSLSVVLVQLKRLPVTLFSVFENSLLHDVFPCTIASELLDVLQQESLNDDLSATKTTTTVPTTAKDHKKKKKETKVLKQLRPQPSETDKRISLLMKTMHSLLKGRVGADSQTIKAFCAVNIVFCILCVELSFPSTPCWLSDKMTSKLLETLSDNVSFALTRLQVAVGSPQLLHSDCLSLFVCESGRHIGMVADREREQERLRLDKIVVSSSRVEYMVWLLKSLYRPRDDCEVGDLKKKWLAIQSVVADFDYAQKLLVISPQKVKERNLTTATAMVEIRSMPKSDFTEFSDVQEVPKVVEFAEPIAPVASVPVKSKPVIQRQNSLISARAPIVGHRLNMGRTHAVTVNPQLSAHNLKVTSNTLPAHITRNLGDSSTGIRQKSNKRTRQEATMETVTVNNNLSMVSPSSKRNKRTTLSQSLSPSFSSPVPATPLSSSQRQIIEGTPMDYYNEILDVQSSFVLFDGNRRLQLDDNDLNGNGQMMSTWTSPFGSRTPTRLSRSITRSLTTNAMESMNTDDYTPLTATRRRKPKQAPPGALNNDTPVQVAIAEAVLSVQSVQTDQADDISHDVNSHSPVRRGNNNTAGVAMWSTPVPVRSQERRVDRFVDSDHMTESERDIDKDKKESRNGTSKVGSMLTRPVDVTEIVSPVVIKATPKDVGHRRSLRSNLTRSQTHN